MLHVDDIRGLTFQQPMASAIIFGPKRVENRNSNIGRIPVGGIWIVIHAGKGLWPTTRECVIENGWTDCPEFEELPRGVVLGLAHVTENIPYDPLVQFELQENKWATGPWCMMIDEVIPFEEPVLMRGKQGLWRLTSRFEKMALGVLEAHGRTVDEVDVRELL